MVAACIAYHIPRCKSLKDASSAEVYIAAFDSCQTNQAPAARNLVLQCCVLLLRTTKLVALSVHAG